MKLKAKLNLVKDVKAGASVGYGGTVVIKSDTKLGVVALGYADGIPRNTNNLAGVFVDKKRAPIIGRVSMDQFVVDLGITSTAKTGDEVIIYCVSCLCPLIYCVLTTTTIAKNNYFIPSFCGRGDP